MNIKTLILLSTYNGEKYIEEQILSLQKQKDVNIHILIRDDGSTDSTISIIKKLKKMYNNISLLEGSNVGCAKSFFELLILAYKYKNIEYYAFCDQDDIWLEDKLKRAVKLLDLYKNNELEQILYCSNLWIVNKQLNNKRLKYSKGYVRIDKLNSLAESYATGCTMVFSRPVIDFFNNNRPKRIHLHDLWIYHQCIFLGKVIYDDESYILYRQHENNVVGAKTSLASKIKSKLRSIVNIRKQHYREYEAQEIINIYSKLINPVILKQIKLVAYYKKNINFRIKLFLSKKIVRRNFWNNILFKIRIILGVI